VFHALAVLQLEGVETNPEILLVLFGGQYRPGPG
jgi:hypothetical protein